MSDQSIELIFVYNADSSIFNVVKDALHKTISPSTYQCNLCALTYGRVRMKEEWKSFIDKLEIPSQFLHRDEFFRKLELHPHNIEDVEFPAIFLNKGGKISLIITSDEINKRKTLKELMELITDRLRALVPE